MGWSWWIRDGRLIRNAIIWADQRSAGEIEKIYQTVGKDAYRSVALNSPKYRIF